MTYDFSESTTKEAVASAFCIDPDDATFARACWDITLRLLASGSTIDLYQSFVWANTPQGHDYWRDRDDSLEPLNQEEREFVYYLLYCLACTGHVEVDETPVDALAWYETQGVSIPT